MKQHGLIKIALLIILVFIVIIVYLKKHYKSLENEGFTAAFGDKLDSRPWPINDDNGLTPLVLNNKLLPVYTLGVSKLGSISYIIGQYFQRKIYPVKLLENPSTNVILAGLSVSAKANKNIPDVNDDNILSLDLGFIREPQLLALSRVETGIKSISVLAPAYWETLYLIGNKYTKFSGLSGLKTVNRRLGANIDTSVQKIGVLRDGLLYWDAIIRALDLEIGRDFLKSESDDLALLFHQLERRELDAIFFISHTFDARLQAFLKTNETRMLSIYPQSPYPNDTDMTVKPYNPETTNLIAKFKSDMKVYIPWIFEETISLGKSVGSGKEKGAHSLGTLSTAGSSIYKTFKIRAYLCCNRFLGRDQQFITMLGNRFLQEYQSMGLLIQEWGNGSTRRNNTNTSKDDSGLPKQLVLPTLVFSDYDSFNPDILGAIPTEIDLNPIMRDLIANIYGRIKIENKNKSCDI